MEEFDARSDGKTWGKPWENHGQMDEEVSI